MMYAIGGAIYPNQSPVDPPEPGELIVPLDILSKRTTKKPIFRTTVTNVVKSSEKGIHKKEYYDCPSCGKHLYIQNHIETENSIYRFPEGFRPKFCYECGQALKWEE